MGEATRAYAAAAESPHGVTLAGKEAPGELAVHARWLRAVPNALTVSRLALAVAFPWLPAPWRLPAAAAGALTDFADGALSRRLGATSAAGRLLDPVADKALVLAVVGTLLAQGSLGPWEAVLLASRDLVVVAGCLVLLAAGYWQDFRRSQPTRLGKAVTFLQMVYLLAVLLRERPVPWLFVPTALLSASAGADYVRRYLRMRREAARTGGRGG